MTAVQSILFKYQDTKYGDFIAKLVPTEPRKDFIGVRCPSYNKIMNEVLALPAEELKAFYKDLPHKYHEENKLHICLINSTKNYEECVGELEHFLPYITDWDVSDGLRPKVFARNKEKLIQKLPLWIKDEKPYTIRVGILLLMKYFLDEAFKTEYLEWVAKVRSEEYYVNMMIAWFFAEALAKQWDCAVTYIKEQRLAPWTHNKAIQKARESFRITAEQKSYLNELKIKIPKNSSKD